MIHLSQITPASISNMIVPFSYGAWGVLMMSSATFNSLGKAVDLNFDVNCANVRYLCTVSIYW